jgi:DNA gyrase subunit A
MAGIRVNDNAQVIFFGAVDASQSVDVITVSTSFQTLVGTDSGRIKLSSFADYPGKGRGTGGLRSHALLKGEDALLVAWVGPTPARANGLDGSPRDLPREYGKRDGSGEKLTGDITYLGAAGLN